MWVSDVMVSATPLRGHPRLLQGVRPLMAGAACIRALVLRVQVRMLIASELPALHRFNSSLLESYVEVSQKSLPFHL